MPSNLIELIENITMNTTTEVKTSYETTTSITINKGIRQEDFLSPFLNNLIMDQMLGALQGKHGYYVRKRNINNVLCR